jgi:IS5 family transposase
VAGEALKQLEKKLGEIPKRLERLKKSGMKKRSRTDEDSRFLRQRQGYVLGYTGTVAVSEDYLIVGQQVSQAGADNELLVPMVERVEQECGERPEQVSADSGFFTQENVKAMEERGIDAYVPDSHLAHELNRGKRVRMHGAARDPAQQRMRRKLRSPAGRVTYGRRKQIVEPRIGTLKEQHGMRRFRMRGLAKVTVEFTLANTALNLMRLWRTVPALVRTR